nr:PAS domain S-box protein [Desulfobulbaceae bacterium]
MNARERYSTTSQTNKLLLVGLLTLFVIGIGLFSLFQMFSDFQTVLTRETEKHSLLMRQHLLVGELVATVESDVRDIRFYVHEPMELDRVSSALLTSLNAVVNDLEHLSSFEKRDLVFETVLQYQESLASYLSLNQTLRLTHEQLHVMNSSFLDKLNAIEVATGELMIESVLAGADLKGLQQIYSLIPYCREQVLRASIFLEDDTAARSNRFLPHTVPELLISDLIVNSITTMERTLETITSASGEIVVHVQDILEEIPRYRTLVNELQTKITQADTDENTIASLRETLLINLKKIGENVHLNELSGNMSTLVKRSSLVAAFVCLVIFGVTIFAWGFIRHLTNQMEDSRNSALVAKNELKLTNDQLNLEMKERQLAEVHLRESEERFRALIEKSSDIVVILNKDGQYKYVSPAVSAFGYFPDEMIGKLPQDFVLDEDKSLITETIKQSMEVPEKSIRTSVIRFCHKNGSVFRVEGLVTNLLDHPGVEGVVFTGRDVTERERMIEELQTALNEVRTLQGLLPICASCKKIRDDSGLWENIEAYIQSNSNAVFSHGICPDCAKSLYPEFAEQMFPGDSKT